MPELNKQLLAKTDAKACEENIVLCGNVRVTVLTATMLRVEFSTDGNLRTYHHKVFGTEISKKLILQQKKMQMP